MSFNPNKRKRAYTTKRGTRKRRKPLGPTLTKSQVKALIRSEQETKFANVMIDTTATEVIAALPCEMIRVQASGFPMAPSVTQPTLVAGDATGQRSGNKVFMKSVHVRLAMYSIPDTENVASRPSVVRCIILWNPGLPTNTVTDILDEKSYANGASLALAQYSMNPDQPYKILYDRTFAPERIGGITEISDVPTYAVGGQNHFVKKTFKINKEVAWESASSLSPIRGSLQVYFLNDDDNVVLQTPTWGIRGSIRFKYSDA